jgi:hypothetical protein
LGEQVALLTAVSVGVLEDIPVERVDAFRTALGPWLAQHCPETVSLDEQATALSDELRDQLTTALKALAHSISIPAINDPR